MNYLFPKIIHIDDILPAIKDSPEFIIARKESYTVVNYVVATHDTFPDVGEKFCPGCKRFNAEIVAEGCGSQRCPDDIDMAAIRRECRGLVFDLEGKLINRRYHKFFNVNERDETAIHAIDWSRPHVILEKLDGSMVSPCFVHGHLRWMTKMGLTDTSMEAEVFVASRPEYASFARFILSEGCTAMFEWCSNKNRIVLDYPEDRLVLTAIRTLHSGTYVPYDDMCRYASEFNIPVVGAFEPIGDDLVDQIRKWEDAEGVVVRFDDGHMVKIKSEWYVRIHKVKSLLGQERDVVSLILNNELDDMLPVLPREDVERVEKFQKVLSWRLGIHAETLRLIINEIPQQMDRKTFALERAPGINAVWRGMIFQHWDSGPVGQHLTYQAIVDMIKKNCGSNASYAKVKEAFLKEVNYV